MKEIKDPVIKLFGMKIPLPENGKIHIFSGEESEFDDSYDVVSMEDNGFNRSVIETHCLEGKEVSRVVEGAEQEVKKDPIVEKPSETKQQDLPPTLITQASTNPETVSESYENPKTPSIDEETATPKPPENDQSDTNDSDQKNPKKPDKIIPCPRCNSMDTKFCYYNNYNINQPRYFCKSCQRYWTSGGTMRNVPVGAGRRKNKNSASHCRQITISEVLQAAKIDVQNGINGTVLSFGSDGMLCEPMASDMNLVEKRVPNCSIENGYYKIDRGNSGSCDDCSGGSSVTTTNSTEEGRKNGFQEPIIGSLNEVPCQIPCLPGFPWPYPWNLGLPMSFYPVPYWNFGVPGSWNGLQSCWSVPNLSPTSPKINKNSPNLGKHSRDGDLIMKNPEEKEAVETKELERCILIPKTLRIDDPDEAAKSSIWATLGIKSEFNSKGSLFKAFQPKGDQKNHVPKPSPALWANPAAFSRSQSFQETS